MRNVGYQKYLTLLWSLSTALFLQAQPVFDILIPVDKSGKMNQFSETGNILEQLHAHAISLGKENCYETVKSSLKEMLNREVFFLNNGTPYKLIIDYNNCRVVSLEANLGVESNFSSSLLIYEIQTYEEELSATGMVKNEVDYTPRHALLATYQENGKWIAIGPYITTDEFFSTEQDAIARLHYRASEMKFICMAGKFRIYGLNKPLEYDARDVRKIVEQYGGDFPPGFTDKKPEGFNGYRKSELVEMYDEKVDAHYSLYTSATRSRILARFTNLSEAEQAVIILKPADGKILVKKLSPGYSTNLVFYGSDFEVQVVYNKHGKQEQEFNLIDFIKGVIRKHVTKDGDQIKSTSAVFGVRG
jgi:hypothetical protein